MNLSVPGLIILSGPCGIGKSHAIRYIMYKLHCENPPAYGIAFSNTGFVEGNLDYMPNVGGNTFVHPTYNPKPLKRLLRAQKKLSEETGSCPLAFVLLDDCAFDSFGNDKTFGALCTQYRHYNIIVIVSTQYIHKLTPHIRECARQILMFQTDNATSLEALWRCFGQRYKTRAEFTEFLLANTGQHKFLFYDRVAQSPASQYKCLRCPSRIPTFVLEFASG